MAAKKQALFDPVFTITPAIASNLMRIEAVRQAIQSLPITPRLLASLRETARLFSTHYSTMIEGNRLTQEQVVQVIGEEQHFPGRERDEGEVKGYYAALDEVERAAQHQEAVTEAAAQRLHALVMGGGKTRVRPTPYRDGQNVIRDSRSSGIVYMPPESKDVPHLMKQLVAWLNRQDELPVPIRAGIAHYQFGTIHPYYDGNGRTARLPITQQSLYTPNNVPLAYFYSATLAWFCSALDKHVLLHLGAVDRESQVYVNGKRVGVRRQEIGKSAASENAGG